MTRATALGGQTSGSSIEGSRRPLTAAPVAGAGAGAAAPSGCDDVAVPLDDAEKADSRAVASRCVTSVRSLYSRTRAERACRIAYCCSVSTCRPLVSAYIAARTQLTTSMSPRGYPSGSTSAVSVEAPCCNLCQQRQERIGPHRPGSSLTSSRERTDASTSLRASCALHCQHRRAPVNPTLSLCSPQFHAQCRPCAA